MADQTFDAVIVGGGTKALFLAMYLAMIATYGALALAIAIPLGWWAGYRLAMLIADLLNANLGEFRFVPNYQL